MISSDRSLTRWRHSWSTENKRRTLRGISVCCVAFCVFFLPVGNFYASSVLYDELVKRPCDNDIICIFNFTGDSTNCTDGRRNPTGNNTCCHDNATESEECGGFGQSRGNTAWITSVQLGCMMITSPLAGVLVDRFGCRKVAVMGGLLMAAGIFASSLAPSLLIFILLYGVVGGCGVGFLYSPTIVIVSRYFKKRHSIANGVAVSGTGLGTMLLGLFAHYVIKAVDWRGYMRVYGGLILFLTCLTLLYKPVGNTKNSSYHHGETKEKSKIINGPCSEGEIGLDNISEIDEDDFDLSVHNCTHNQPTLKRKLVDWKIWKQASFLLYVGTTNFMVLGLTVPMVHLVRLARDINIVGSDAALLLTYMGIGSLAGRIFLGLFAANKRLKPTVLFGLCIGLAGLPMLIVPQIKTYEELCVFVVWLGYFVGGQTTLQAVVLRHLVGADRLSQTLGWSMGLQAPAALGGGPIAGFLHDASGNYSWSFYFGGSVALVATAIWSFLPCARRYDAHRDLFHEKLSIEKHNEQSQVNVADIDGLIEEGEILLEETSEV